MCASVARKQTSLSRSRILVTLFHLPASWLPIRWARLHWENYVELFVLKNAGARPWDRDGHDVRVLANAAEGRGKIIDSQAEVGGYPVIAPSYRAFDPALWDLETMLPKSPEALDASQKGRGT